ncbi:pyridoxamine 5'-phosphate oxidase family protein [Cupriavidus basilensis]|uniref:Pyridoxamine 5'-phosphate oxidase family protein n=1 Tax=Cupriavidus basilensis TaxID=68895 RepID=A0ABT6AMX1_9BURK|nr:pyridoxamine 5'-phosphate oxidase family protein [Cupriavidus basilensis]MDF3833652.1 pyridoxamine 5'-phosphate oxidase family protein [Cupriavidus basilensis]
MQPSSLADAWPTIRDVIERGQRSSLYCALASVGADGMPTVTPIGTVFPRADQTAFFFDRYTSTLAANLAHSDRVCLMAVDSGKGFWFRSLLAGRFRQPPGVRLYGTVGPLRPATQAELQQIEARVKGSRWLKGTRMLWSSFTHVRDIRFTAFRPVAYPVMMDGLWEKQA